MIRKLLIITLCFILSDGLLCKEISKIKLVYGNEGTLVRVAATCTPESFNWCFGHSLNFLTTYDDIFLYNFSFLYDKLTPADENDSIDAMDPRIMAIITYDDAMPNDTVCFGDTYGISKNGTYMKDNKQLLKLVKDKIGWGYGINRKDPSPLFLQ